MLSTSFDLSQATQASEAEYKQPEGDIFSEQKPCGEWTDQGVLPCSSTIFVTLKPSHQMLT